MKQASRYVMLGGFLGAGKSTAMGRLARRLSDRGLRVGLITNDQASGLVDTTNLRSQGFPVEEIAGGCFCCRFNSLLDAARSLDTATRPDVFLAEPVGSCTDLVATVSYPLRRIYGDEFRIAPFSVLVDPLRARRVLGLSDERGFSPKVVYVYRKQLEEADWIVVNKRDLLDRAELDELVAKLRSEFPGKEIFTVSAREGDGLEDWFGQLESAEASAGHVLDIDYDDYAEGEALLGWLNATLVASSQKPFDANRLIEELAARLGRRLEEAGAVIAHLKMTFVPDAAVLDEIALVSLVRDGFVPELAQTLPDDVPGGQLVVNLRAEASPEELQAALDAEIASEIQVGSEPDGVSLVCEHVECFRPGRPVPTHRMGREASGAAIPGDRPDAGPAITAS